MQVTLTYHNTRLRSITFENWSNDLSRMARIDIDIVRAVGLCGVGTHTPKGGTAQVFDREFAGEQVGFSKIEEEKIKKVLAGYCIEPEVRNV